MEDKTIVALEFGSSKIKGALGTLDSSGALTVRAIEEEKLIDCINYGCIRNVAEVARTAREVLDRLERRMAPRRIEFVYVGIGGRSVGASVIDIERRLSMPTEINAEFVKEVLEEALRRSIHDRVVFETAPREYRVDGIPTSQIEGVLASHVSAKINVISCREQLLRNLEVVMDERLQLNFQAFSRQMAQADLVLLNDSRRLGCMLVDFGADTTAVSIYKGGVLLHMVTLPMGSRNITRDITRGLNYLEERAEDMKIAYGNAYGTSEGGPEVAMVNPYVAARAGEIIANIQAQITAAGLTPDMLPEGIFVIGNGSQLAGFNDRLAEMTGMKVRQGLPPQRIRITDGRKASEAVDVISILAAAARRSPRECLSDAPKSVFTPAATQPQGYQQQPQQQPAYQQQPYQQQPYQQQPLQQPYQQPVYEQPQEAAYEQPQYAEPVQEPVQPAYQQPQQQSTQEQTRKVPYFPKATGDEEQSVAPPQDGTKTGGIWSRWIKRSMAAVGNLVSDPPRDDDDD